MTILKGFLSDLQFVLYSRKFTVEKDLLLCQKQYFLLIYLIEENWYNFLLYDFIISYQRYLKTIPLHSKFTREKISRDYYYKI